MKSKSATATELGEGVEFRLSEEAEEEGLVWLLPTLPWLDFRFFSPESLISRCPLISLISRCPLS